MANVFLEKIESLGLLPLNTKLLDFGCGKSLATRHILNKAVGIDACLYDVSYDYVGFWREFVGPESCACHQLPDDWLERFDVVTSFFSMEHMVDPYSELAKIWGVLKQGGIFYVVIPDMYRDNYADMLVVDHVQHFSESSLVLMLAKAGFELVELDRGSHFQAQILIARKSSSKELMCGVVVEQVLETINRCKKIGEYWRRFGDHLSSFEFDSAKRHENLRYVIIGAGVIGTYIYSLLQFPDRVLCFVDSNEFKQDKGWLDKPVVSAFDLSCFDGEVVYFSGLNPYQEDKYLAGLLPNGCISSKIFTTKSIEV
jgi:SAM-dependent methyltransferase